MGTPMTAGTGSMDVFDAIASPHRAPAFQPPAQAVADQAQQLSYDLAKRVPAMEHGFTIATSYGDMEVTGALARRIAGLVQKALAAELARLEARR